LWPEPLIVLLCTTHRLVVSAEERICILTPEGGGFAFSDLYVGTRPKAAVRATTRRATFDRRLVATDELA